MAGPAAVSPCPGGCTAGECGGRALATNPNPTLFSNVGRDPSSCLEIQLRGHEMCVSLRKLEQERNCGSRLQGPRPPAGGQACERGFPNKVVPMGGSPHPEPNLSCWSCEGRGGSLPVCRMSVRDAPGTSQKKCHPLQHFCSSRRLYPFGSTGTNCP